MTERKPNLFERVGATTFDLFHNTFYAFGFFWNVLGETFRFRSRSRVSTQVLVMQILFTGVNALFIITLIAVSLGTVIIFYGNQITTLVSTNFVYTILITVITRELGPLLTAFIVMARSGVAIATEISSMVVTHEIEAYLAVGINPISYLVVPRFLGVTLSMVALNLYFNLSGLAASYLVAQFFHPIPANEYFGQLMTQLTPTAVASSVVKSLAFGFVISMVSTLNGFRAQQSTTEIPIIVIRAVGQGFALLIVVNILITLVFPR
ncbi:MAG: ABC transporter permease [Spirochaetales bacterium]|nr:ABC transporter permease [Spirochaetales bacterium]